MRKAFQRTNPSSSAKADTATSQLVRLKSFYQPEEFVDREFPLVYKPKVIKRVDENCYIFYCTVKGNTGNRFNKNMIALVHNNNNNNNNSHTMNHPSSEEQQVHGSTLSVINALRLSPEGEEKLLELGVLRHIIRLGPSEHAAFEDNYYIAKFPNLQRWAPGPLAACPHLPIHHILYDTTNTRSLKSTDPIIKPVSPHSDILVFVFEETVEPEAILFLTTKRVLIAGDCLQHQIDNPFISDRVKEDYLEPNGLLAACIVVSETWLRTQSVVTRNSKKMIDRFQTKGAATKAFFASRSGKFKLHNDFSRLLRLEIARFISTSGNVILQNDKVKTEIKTATELACQLVN
jgi:hypothetical protein